MQDTVMQELIDDLWGRFDETSAELVKAKRRLREGTGTEQDLRRQRALLLALRADLAEFGETADPVEPGDV